MNKGAKFYKCDFQVHSPRDIAWTGTRFGMKSPELEQLTEEEKVDIIDRREQFCKEYLDKIRNAGLNAIAMTDHHDVTFVKHLRKIANDENEVFELTGENEKMITVFPGIELTISSPPSQAILILDSGN